MLYEAINYILWLLNNGFYVIIDCFIMFMGAHKYNKLHVKNILAYVGTSMYIAIPSMTLVFFTMHTPA